MTTAVEINVRSEGLYVNGRWVIDVDYERIAVSDRTEAIYYSALWNTSYRNEGDAGEELWWVELPDDLKRRTILLARILTPILPLPFN